MAKQTKTQPVIVTCTACGKQILPTGGWSIPVDYLHCDGKNYCLDCMRAGKSRPPVIQNRNPQNKKES